MHILIQSFRFCFNFMLANTHSNSTWTQWIWFPTLSNDTDSWQLYIIYTHISTKYTYKCHYSNHIHIHMSTEHLSDWFTMQYFDMRGRPRSKPEGFLLHRSIAWKTFRYLCWWAMAELSSGDQNTPFGDQNTPFGDQKPPRNQPEPGVAAQAGNAFQHYDSKSC